MIAPFPSHNPPMTPSWSQLRCAMLGMLGYAGLYWVILVMPSAPVAPLKPPPLSGDILNGQDG